MSPIEDLDAQIAMLEVELAQLKRSRNRLSWTHQLPHDVLVEIFFIVQCSPVSRDASSSLWSCYDATWSRVMCVCHHFRAIAVQVPLLWNIMDLQRDHQEWQNLCLQRSRGAPLYITGSLDAAAIQSLPRTRAAHLTVRKIRNNHSLDVAAPALEKLSLQTPSSFYLQSCFLGGLATKLSHLTVSGRNVVLHEGIMLPGLRHVDFQSGATKSPGGSLEPLLGLLEHAVDLHSVKIDGFCLSEPRGKLPLNHVILVPRRISLPRLHDLSIHCDLAELSALVRCLPLPAATLAIDATLPSPADMMSPLTPNHDIIFDTWLGFARSRPDAVILERGAIYPSRVVGERLGWCVVMFQDGNKRSRCTFSCAPQVEHRIFLQIGTLRIHGLHLSLKPPFLADLEGYFALGVMPHLREVALDCLASMICTPEHMQHVRGWIVRRGGAIVRVTVRSCGEAARAFAHGLQRDGIVPEVVYMD
jgi:hypothetical protein